ncbi:MULTISPECIES: hypothetical protein [unclassified Bradyrhizobium]|uniref:hypothetical protein n=1 Tax=unclassified Bradyrhizobium TaxID=2631580 RepID=UPI002916A54A|nr:MULTISPECIES: hypothetical protein [unclassified Bradyrhizobium]
MADVESGQRFPFINVEKAIGRASELYGADQRGGEMSIAGAFSVWGYSEKSSGGHQTVAALKAYGLLLAPQPGKIQLSKDALAYFRDERDEPRNKLLQGFARKPPMMRSLWNAWGAQPPADTLARSHLKVDRGLSEQSARALLGIYKENIAFANLKGDDKIPELDLGIKVDDPPAPKVKLGDIVQWTSGGVDQLDPPARVMWISEDGNHLRVHGSLTGIPMNEVSVVAAPPPKPITPTPPVVTDAVNSNADISVLLKDGRLEIAATVDADGLKTLKEMLVRYEGILELLKPKTQ